MSIFIITSGFTLIYSITELKIVEEKIDLRAKFNMKNHNRDVDELIKKYNEFKTQVNDNSISFKQQIGKSYLPYGPQTNVSLTTVLSGGWINCYSNGYQDEISADLGTIFNQFCTSPYLMIACKKRANENIDILAWAGKNHVLFPSKTDFDFHMSHGTKWIYNSSSYIGFANQNDKVVIGVIDWNKNDDGKYLQVRCDIYASLAGLYGDSGNNSKRLCWPIFDRQPYEYNNNVNELQWHSYFGRGGTCFGSEWHEPDRWERMIFERQNI